MTARRPLAWIIAFGRFWYHFVVGDDWRLAVAVVAALVVTAVLVGHRITAYWLVPAVVITSVALHLHRAGATRR